MFNKVGVYAICKNELQHIEEWIKRSLEADYVVLYDTGSTDGTWGVILNYKRRYPDKIICEQNSIDYESFSFADARQHALEMLPDDDNMVCIQNDIDQYIEPTFKEEVLTLANKNPNFKQIILKTNENVGIGWSHTEIHHRHDCYWFGTVHEYLVNTNNNYTQTISSTCKDWLTHHFTVGKNHKQTRYIEKMNKELAIHPYNISVHYFRSSLLRDEGRLNEARDYYKQSLPIVHSYVKSYEQGELKDWYCNRLFNDWATYENFIQLGVSLSIDFTEFCNDIKVCCYAICADEPEEYIDKWLESMSKADKIVVLVTKKNNPNYTYLKSKQTQYEDKLIVAEEDIKPWRFDTARNKSMKYIPEEMDVLICTDIDEILIDDFWTDVKVCAYLHPTFDKINYRYAWSHDEKNNPMLVFDYSKITANTTDYIWKYPVHEVLVPVDENKTEKAYSLDSNKIYLHHYPDNTKSRSSYLELIKQRVEENSEDDFSLFYLQRELSFLRDYPKAIETATKLYLLLSMRKNEETQLHFVSNALGVYYGKLGLYDDAIYWYKKSISYMPTAKEPYMRLAQLYIYKGMIDEAKETLEQSDKNSKYFEDWRQATFVWKLWKRYQIIGDILCWEEKYQDAAACFKFALSLIETQEDKNDALNEGFYDDYNWIARKINNT